MHPGWPRTLIALVFASTTACGGAPPTASPEPEIPAPLDLVAATSPDAKPPWDSPETYQAICDRGLAGGEALREQVASVAGPRTVENTLVPFNDLSTQIDAVWGLAGILTSLNPDASMREAGEACEQRLQKFANDVKRDRRLYEAVAAVDVSAAEPDVQRFAARVQRDFRRAGVDRDEATRAQLNAIDAEMVELSQQFSRNLREDIRSIEVDPASLEGLPEDFVAGHAPGDNGKVRITTDYPDFFPFETYSKDSDARHRLYAAFINRGHPKNTEVISTLLERRHTYANLLGYPTWAAYMAEDKMVKSAERIDSFIRELTEVVAPISEREIGVLLERKKKDDPTAERIEVWDRFYYAGKVREEQHDFDARTVRPYFAYPRVKEGIFALYSELFGVRFERLPDAAVWHPSVEAWAMYQGDAPVGRFYLDMHPRDGKFKHAAMFQMQTGLSTNRTPVGALGCNFPDPSTGDALMEHSQVVTFFHEFGHLIYQLIPRKTPWHELSSNGIEWDFVETPSQLLEEWTWEPTVLARFAHHFETDEPIPAELVKRMRAAEEFGKGIHVMRQLFYAAFSFYSHNRAPGFDLDDFSDEIFASYSPYPPIADTHIHTSFGHLVGYSSSYYTYQWSLVIAKDLFTQFRGKLLDAQVSRAYRTHILEPGASKDAEAAVESFLGRPYNLDAYKAWLAGEWND